MRAKLFVDQCGLGFCQGLSLWVGVDMTVWDLFGMFDGI